MPERNLGEIPPAPEVAMAAPERKPYYPSVHIGKQKLGDLFDKINVGDSLEAEFVVKCVSKNEDAEGGGSLCLELVSIEIEAEEDPKDMISAARDAFQKLLEGE